MANKLVYQFKISLLEINPAIWRRIQVPNTYSFWDLHVAIQDSMGWLDCHLHAFRFGSRKSKERTEIGIPVAVVLSVKFSINDIQKGDSPKRGQIYFPQKARKVNQSPF